MTQIAKEGDVVACAVPIAKNTDAVSNATIRNKRFMVFSFIKCVGTDSTFTIMIAADPTPYKPQMLHMCNFPKPADYTMFRLNGPTEPRTANVMNPCRR